MLPLRLRTGCSRARTMMQASGDEEDYNVMQRAIDRSMQDNTEGKKIQEMMTRSVLCKRSTAACVCVCTWQWELIQPRACDDWNHMKYEPKKNM
jgi:hypothetical protein